jgi:hypothetical protein
MELKAQVQQQMKARVNLQIQLEKYTADGLKAPTTAGSYDIQAHYGGNSLFSASNSATSRLTVTTAP